jgi:hypothetical protein
MKIVWEKRFVTLLTMLQIFGNYFAKKIGKNYKLN